MEDKLNKILELSEKTNERVCREDGILVKSLHIFEKLIIPLMLDVLAYVANSASNNISHAQLSLAQAEAARKMTKNIEQN